MEVPIRFPPLVVKFLLEEDDKNAKNLSTLIEHELRKPENVKKLKEFVDQVSKTAANLVCMFLNFYCIYLLNHHQ